MGYLRTLAKKCRRRGKEEAENPDAPAVADGNGGHADWVKIGLLLLKEDIDKPLRKLEDYLNEMSDILSVFGLDKSPDYTSFSKWDKEFPTRTFRRPLLFCAYQ